MRQHLYVISDLHLGGDPAEDGTAGFQICPPATQKILAIFIDGLPAATKETNTRLVIAGDIVDFLAEEPFADFTEDETAALAKFHNIVKNTKPVWESLRRFVGEKRGALTLMLGNHDIELSLPSLREALHTELGEGRVEFIYDNEAFTVGPVLIEHGNRFDAWNAVPHGALRRVRSQLSRRLPVSPKFPTLPGSRLVVEVMNGLKKDFHFIDLLKPEKAGALPVAAALGAGGVRDVWKFFVNFSQTWFSDYDETTGEPKNQERIAAGGSPMRISAKDQEFYNLAQELLPGGERISIVGELSDKARREALFKAMRKMADTHREAYAIDHEDEEYLKPIQHAASKGWQVVVYGHTHLAKRKKEGNALYLNTGTWADLMRMPDEVWQDDANKAREALYAFVDDLFANRLDAWRRSLPTYAHIELDDNLAVKHADVYFASDDEAITSEGIWQRLKGEVTSG
ncbi:MAG: metallophosphoesterase [Proteobacteria bacterium]|nr:metallophosphoesterase [Pseudomonadota bacterium]